VAGLLGTAIVFIGGWFFSRSISGSKTFSHNDMAQNQVS